MNREKIEVVIGVIIAATGIALLGMCFFIGKSFLYGLVTFSDITDQTIIRLLFYAFMFVIGIILLYKGSNVIRGREQWTKSNQD